MDEPTAWQDINPVAPPPEQRLACSERLQPASPEQFRDELTACLALVAPVGMTEEGRAEWLSVAWITLQDLPADLLALGCAEARKTCDHPSKLVPAIIAATDNSMKMRRQAAEPYVQHRIEGPSKAYVTADEASSILKQYGLRS